VLKIWALKHPDIKNYLQFAEKTDRKNQASGKRYHLPRRWLPRCDGHFLFWIELNLALAANNDLLMIRSEATDGGAALASRPLMEEVKGNIDPARN
jgi:hypothetical protein